MAICPNVAENLNVPSEIGVGPGSGRDRLASTFLRQCRHYPTRAIPLFMKEDPAEVAERAPLRYLGVFRATDEECSAAALATRPRATEPVVRVLYLTRVRD